MISDADDRPAIGLLVDGAGIGVRDVKQGPLGCTTPAGSHDKIVAT
jgi:hypothetical protein